MSQDEDWEKRKEKEEKERGRRGRRGDQDIKAQGYVPAIQVAVP